MSLRHSGFFVTSTVQPPGDPPQQTIRPTQQNLCHFVAFVVSKHILSPPLSCQLNFGFLSFLLFYYVKECFMAMAALAADSFGCGSYRILPKCLSDLSVVPVDFWHRHYLVYDSHIRKIGSCDFIRGIWYFYFPSTQESFMGFSRDDAIRSWLSTAAQKTGVPIAGFPVSALFLHALSLLSLTGI